MGAQGCVGDGFCSGALNTTGHPTNMTLSQGRLDSCRLASRGKYRRHTITAKKPKNAAPTRMTLRQRGCGPSTRNGTAPRATAAPATTSKLTPRLRRDPCPRLSTLMTCAPLLALSTPFHVRAWAPSRIGSPLQKSHTLRASVRSNRAGCGRVPRSTLRTAYWSDCRGVPILPWGLRGVRSTVCKRRAASIPADGWPCGTKGIFITHRGGSLSPRASRACLRRVTYTT